MSVRHLQRKILASLLAVAAALALPAWPSVLSTGESGFVVREEVPYAGSAQAAWQRLVRVQDWWNSEHTWSGDAANLSLALEPGGCWCERLSNGGFVHHMQVVFVQPGSMLRMTGGLGPLQGMAVAGALTFSLKPDPDHAGWTRVVLEYAVGGYSAAGFGKLSEAVDHVLGEQMTRYATLP